MELTLSDDTAQLHRFYTHTFDYHGTDVPCAFVFDDAEELLWLEPNEELYSERGKSPDDNDFERAGLLCTAWGRHACSSFLKRIDISTKGSLSNGNMGSASPLLTIKKTAGTNRLFLVCSVSLKYSKKARYFQVDFVAFLVLGRILEEQFVLKRIVNHHLVHFRIRHPFAFKGRAGIQTSGGHLVIR